MKQMIRHIIILCMLLSIGITKADIYYVFYATINGKSGHAGIAIDNYKVIAKDEFNAKNERITKYHTIKDGTLSYYDLWPEKDEFNALNVDKNVVAKYYKLPSASWEKDITVHSLLTYGIPHEEFYPVDGLIKIPSTPQKDSAIKVFLDQLIEEDQAFNVRTFNCADFVEQAIEFHCQCAIDAKEQIVFKSSTTPNRLYQELAKRTNSIVIKDASDKAKGSFTMERLLKRTNTN